MDNVEDIIVSSIEDSEMPLESDVATGEGEESTPAVEVAPEGTEAPSEAPVDEASDANWDGRASNIEVGSPAAKPDPNAKPDEFEKKFGIPAMSSSGRENRIPYSRVKKITEKAVNDKAKELEASYAPKLQERDTKIQDYEGRLTKVAEFENVMLNDQDQFLRMLSELPAYKPFFNAVAQAFQIAQSQPAPGQAAQAAPVDDMPQPDQKLSDGTMVYSMEGLKALNTWNRTQAREETLAEVNKRFGPIEDQWKAHQKVQAVIPQVQKQIDEARQWPQFNDNEAEIVKALQANPQLTLEGAYRQVVFPRMVADRNKIREEVLREVKQAPRATSAPSQGARPGAQATNAPRSLEDVIKQSMESLKR